MAQTNPSEKEKTILVVRQAPWRLVWISVPAIALIGLMFFFLVPLLAQGIIGRVIFTLGLLLGISFISRQYMVWRLTKLTITDRRVIDSDQQKLFHRVISAVELINIQDVFYRVRGPGQTLGRLGTLVIVFNDKKTKIEIKNVNQPEKIQQLILDLQARGVGDRLALTKRSAQELIAIAQNIKAIIGEEQFKKISEDEESQ